MSYQFKTAFQNPAGTLPPDIQVVTVEADAEHSELTKLVVAQGAPALITLVRDGLAAGWLRIVE